MHQMDTGDRKLQVPGLYKVGDDPRYLSHWSVGVLATKTYSNIKPTWQLVLVFIHPTWRVTIVASTRRPKMGHLNPWSPVVQKWCNKVTIANASWWTWCEPDAFLYSTTRQERLMVGNSARHCLHGADDWLQLRNNLVYPAIQPYGEKNIHPFWRWGLIKNLRGQDHIGWMVPGSHFFGSSVGMLDLQVSKMARICQINV